MIITVDAVTKEPRVFNGQQQWGVKLPNGEWITLVCGFRPSKGQQFDVAIKEKQGNDGRVFKTATIIAPAPAPAPQEQMPASQRGLTIGQPPLSPTAQPGPLNVKIKWDDWCMVLQSAWQAATDAGMPPAEAVAVVSTTLIAFSNGKLETPIEAGPVSEVEPAQDDDLPEFMK